MDSYFNKKITASGALSVKCLKAELHTYGDIIRFVHQLPYGRNSQRGDFKSILIEQRGTCSTKHAFLKQVAIEQDLKGIKLVLGIYKMTSKNTPKVSKVLNYSSLDFIPEAHTYLKYNGRRYDFTFPQQRSLAFEADLLEERYIQPDAIGTFKVNTHQNYIRQWIISDAIDYSFEDIWDIRERCIDTLSA